MIISGRRIRNIDRRLAAIGSGANIIVGLTDLDRFPNQISQLGFSANSSNGDTILPPAAFGPVSHYNAEGREIVHRDQPMETAHRQAEWHWTEWHGRYDHVERSKIVDVPYERYPRTFDPPPSVELTITTNQDAEKLLITPVTTFDRTNYHRILHTVNLLLEMFGECNIMDENLQSIHQPHLRRLNWNVLPEGRMPWEQLIVQLNPVVEREPHGNQPVIRHRLQRVNTHGPAFVAVGQGGFDGYVIFAFPERHIFILECVHFGNATYVFGENWETLSQMTKAEILSNDMQQDRLVHQENWGRRLDDLFV